MTSETARESSSPAGPARSGYAGMGADAPTTQNARGGKQSHLPYRFDLLDANALFRIAEVLAAGAAKYGVDNWRQIDAADHLNHALAHIFAYLGGDVQDDHLSHAACRALFALAVAEALPPTPTPEPLKFSLPNTSTISLGSTGLLPSPTKGGR